MGYGDLASLDDLRIGQHYYLDQDYGTSGVKDTLYFSPRSRARRGSSKLGSDWRDGVIRWRVLGGVGRYYSSRNCALHQAYWRVSWLVHSNSECIVYCIPLYSLTLPCFGWHGTRLWKMDIHARETIAITYFALVRSILCLI